MDSALLDYYERELSYLRGAAAQFAREYPRQAHWLASENLDVADPYVERLLEGFAFLTARIHQKFDGGYPRLVQSIFQTVYPHFEPPTPSMAIVQLNPLPDARSSGTPVLVPRNSVLRSPSVGRHGTRCEFRTAQDVEVWPLEISEARYYARDLGLLGLPSSIRAQAALRLRLRTRSGQPMRELQLSTLSLHLLGDRVRMKLYEQFIARSRGAIAQEPGQRGPRWRETLTESVRPQGFDPSEAVLPEEPRSFSGYRLLREYFAMPERFLFVQ